MASHGKMPRMKVKLSDAAATFQLPESLTCSEVDFPAITQKKSKATWNQIVEENRIRMKEIYDYDSAKQPSYEKAPFQKTACDFIESEIFPTLLPVLEDTLVRAKKWDALSSQKCFFNGIDWIAQEIWNRNPRHPARFYDQKYIFNMIWVRNYLKEHPRPYYPKSWLWTENYAATLIQKTLRQYFVQREQDVQEMRNFWRKLEDEKEFPQLEHNPFLARNFAAMCKLQQGTRRTTVNNNDDKKFGDGDQNKGNGDKNKGDRRAEKKRSAKN